MSADLPNRIAAYVPTLRTCDDILCLRVILHDFGLVWASSPVAERPELVAEEPEPFDPRWDAFLAAYTEHLCAQDGIERPAWVHNESRYLDEFWFAGGCYPLDRERTISTTPDAFERHGISIPEDELLVV